MESIASVFNIDKFDPFFFVNNDSNSDSGKNLSPLNGPVFTATNFFTLEKFIKDSEEKLAFSGEISYFMLKGGVEKQKKQKKYKFVGDKLFFISAKEAKKNKTPIKYLALKKCYAYLFINSSQHSMYLFCNGVSFSIEFPGLADSSMQAIKDYVRKYSIILPFNRFYEKSDVRSQNIESKNVVLLKSLENSRLFVGKFVEKKKDMKTKDRLKLREIINNYKLINSEHVANLVEVFENETHLIMIIEYYEYCNLKSLVLKKWETFTEQTVKEILRSCLKSLCFFNSKSVLHNEINLTNILINDSEMEVRFIDFSSSVSLSKSKGFNNGTRSGNFYFKAPELYEASGEFSSKSDVYSLGIVFLLLVTGYMPQNLFRNEYYFYIIEELKSKISPAGINLVELMIEHDPAKRITATAALDHIWFKQNNSLLKFGRQEDLLLQKTLVAPNENMKNYNLQAMKLQKGFFQDNKKPTFNRPKAAESFNLSQLDDEKLKFLENLKHGVSEDSRKEADT